jgi:uncharacterized protein
MKYLILILFSLNFDIIFAQNPYGIDSSSYSDDDSLVYKKVFGRNESFEIIDVYYNSGIKAKFEVYVNSELNGPYIEYFPKGGIKELKFYLYGREVGTWYSFFENGNIKAQMEYAISNTDLKLPPTYEKQPVNYEEYPGLCCDTILVKKPYKLPTKATYFFLNGKPEREEHFCDGKKCGVWKYYNEDGVIIKENTF